MSANKVLDMAERQGLLDANVIAELRKQVAESKFIVTPEALAKVLVDHEHLTPFQARKLVAAALGETPPQPEPAAPLPTRGPAPVTPARPAARDFDDLGFADDSGGPPKSPAPAPPPAPAPAEEDVVMLEAVDPLPAAPKPAPARPAPAKPAPAKAPQPSAAKPKAPAPVKPAGGTSPAPRPAAPAARPAPAPAEDEIFDLDPLPAAPAPAAPATPAAKAKWSAPPSKPAPASGDLVPLDGLTPLPATPAPMSPAPMDDLFGSPLGPPSDPLAASGAMLGQPLPGKVKKAKGNVWDSPLLLLGGGTLGVLLVAFGLLAYALTRGSAAEVFAKAEEEYSKSAYASAIAAYDLFLSKYPKDPNASMARVRRGMAQLRQVTDSGQNPRQGLQTAKVVLPEIESEEKFNEARIELATILPDIADGFAQQATQATETAQKEELVRLADEAFALVNNPAYLPASLRKEREGRIANILDRLKVAQRSIQQDKDLAAALAKIGAAEGQGNAKEAYQVRKELLKLYPGLDANSQLIAAIRKVGDKEQQLVKVAEEPVAATTDDPQPGNKCVVLSMREGPAPAAVPTQIAFVLVEGAAYGIDVASGKVLWRRHVGYETLIPPLAVARDDGADALVIDSRQHALLRLEAVTGKLVWRHSIGQPFFRPVISGDKVFVTVRDGRVLQLAAEGGNCVRAAQLPQSAPVAAGFDARSGRLLQPGEHSTLFLLAADGLKCEETFYLGHERGAILVPPIVVLDHVLAIETPADDHTFIHVLARSGESKALAEVGQPFRLKGRIVVPLSVVGRRVVAVTDLGQVEVYEVDAASPQQPVRRIAQTAANQREPTLAYHTADANRLWLADRRCSLFEIQSSLQKLTRKWSLHQDDSFIGPLQTFGDTLVHLRRRAGLPGVSVEGCRADDGSTLWRTDLAVPVAGLVAAEPRKAVDAITQQGRVFAISSEQLKAGYVDTPAFPLPRESRGAIFPEISRSADGAIAGWTETQPGGRSFAYDIASAAAPVSKPLPSADITAINAGVLWRGQAIVPTNSGTVALIGLQANGAQSLPFMPPLEADNLPVWTRPAVLPDESGFVVGDGLTMLYRVLSKSDAGSGGQSYLASAAEKTTEHRFQGTLATAGDTIYGLARGAQGDVIVSLDPETLAAGATWPLQGRAQHGPDLVRGVVFVSSETDGLFCLGAAQKLRWKVPLVHGPLAGPPVPCDDDFLVLSQSGLIVRLSGDSGAELGSVNLEEPLGGAAHVVGQQLFLATSDGAVVLVPVPKQQ